MKRRGFLGFMGGAAVAGPAMAKQAVAQSLDAMRLGTVLPHGIGGGMGLVGGTEAGVPPDHYDPLGWARKDLAQFLGKSASQLLKERLNTQVSHLDPDIAVMRSISLGTTIRMQRDRNFEQNRTRERGWLEERIAEIMNNQHGI